MPEIGGRFQSRPHHELGTSWPEERDEANGRTRLRAERAARDRIVLDRMCVGGRCCRTALDSFQLAISAAGGSGRRRCRGREIAGRIRSKSCWSGALLTPDCGRSNNGYRIGKFPNASDRRCWMLGHSASVSPMRSSRALSSIITAAEPSLTTKSKRRLKRTQSITISIDALLANFPIEGRASCQSRLHINRSYH